MAEYIERQKLYNNLVLLAKYETGERQQGILGCAETVRIFPAADVEPVRHGRWILEAHDERVNYRWNVTAECSECCDERKEIWAGFFPGVPPCIARDAALVSAESVKLSNYCPNCGARMDGVEDREK